MERAAPSGEEVAQPALSGGADEFPKGAAFPTPFTPLRGQHCLRDIEALTVKKREGGFDFGALRGIKPGPAQADGIQTRDAVSIGGHREWRNVFAEGGCALADGEAADAQVLVKDAAATDEDAVFHRDVTAEHGVVRDHDVTAEADIVAEVRAGHEETLIADDRGAAFRRAAMNGGVFADAVVIPNLHAALRGLLEGEILRIAANDRAVTDLVAFAHFHMGTDDGVSLNDAAGADARGPFDDGIGADLDVVGEDGVRVDDGGGVLHDARDFTASCPLLRS